MKLISFGNMVEYYKWIAERSDKLDLEKTLDNLVTLRDSKWSFWLKDGKVIQPPHYMQHFVDINAQLGQMFDPAKSNLINRRVYISAYEDEAPVEIAVVEDTVKEEPVIEADPVEGEVVEELVAEKVEVDWEWIDSLSNTKEDKKVLDEYAESKLGIKLNRTKTLKNMIASLKEQL
ncbi:hypothetical protein NVP1170O_017 [Vibrio phage 1.170.O._10N.261.52.C3]|nr:hypothetical protein NVP1170O_017 [Vibrio phage 1.170.O._10N.261.52.C3]